MPCSAPARLQGMDRPIVKEKMTLVEAVESTDKVARDSSVSRG